MPLPEIISRLRKWARAGGTSLEIEREDLAEAFSFEDGIFRIAAAASEHFLDLGAPQFEEVEVLAEIATPDSFVHVFRGRDPVTALWHQCAWVLILENGKVLRAIRTLSAQLPPHPYDGSLQLRESP